MRLAAITRPTLRYRSLPASATAHARGARVSYFSRPPSTDQTERAVQHRVSIEYHSAGVMARMPMCAGIRMYGPVCSLYSSPWYTSVYEIRRGSSPMRLARWAAPIPICRIWNRSAATATRACALAAAASPAVPAQRCSATPSGCKAGPPSDRAQSGGWRAPWRRI